jgi:transcriptional regulator of aromatic amino acid metabolism
MLRIVGIARHVAPTDVPVLILGESGVGKDVLAVMRGIKIKRTACYHNSLSNAFASRKSIVSNPSVNLP